MFSWARPENDARIRSAPLTRSKIALSLGPCPSGARIMSSSSVSARQASGEKRSRITDAADMRGADQKWQRAAELALLQHRRRDQRRPHRQHVLGDRLPVAEQRHDIGVDVALGLARFGGAVDQRADQAKRRLGALDVAAEPEQIGGGAARQRAGGAVDGDPVRRRQQRGRRDRLVGENPGVGGAAALLQRDGAGVEIVGDADEAARHHHPAVAAPRQQQPQAERPRHQPAVVPDRRGRQRHRLLCDEVDAAAADRLDQARSRLRCRGRGRS